MRPLLHFRTPRLDRWIIISCWFIIIEKLGFKNQEKRSDWPLKICNFFCSAIKTLAAYLFWNWNLVKYFPSMSVGLWKILITCYCAFISRSSRSLMFYKINCLKNFSKFIGKHIINYRLKACSFIKRHRCFPLHIKKFLRTPFLQKNLREAGRLLLHFYLNCFQETFWIFLAHFWSSVDKCFFVCWFLIHQVIIAICFWQYVFSENWGSALSLFFKITCLLWVKEERTDFFFSLFFRFYCLSHLQFQ